MKRKYDYQNKLSFDVLFKWTSLLAAVAILASAYVYIRNQHIRESDYVRQAEREMNELHAEIEMYELRIARMLDRPELEARLEDGGSSLRDIGQATVEVVQIVRARPIAVAVR